MTVAYKALRFQVTILCLLQVVFTFNSVITLEHLLHLLHPYSFLPLFCTIHIADLNDQQPPCNG